MQLPAYGGAPPITEYSGQMTPDAVAVLTFLLITLAAIGLIAIVIYLSR